MRRERFLRLESILLLRKKSRLDKLLVFFTRERGKLLAIAPGAMKIPNRFGGAIEPLNYGILRLYRSRANRYYVRDFEVKNAFFGIRSSPKSLTVALSYLRLLHQLLPYELAEAGVFETSLSFLREVDGGSDPWLLRAVALVKSLYFLGFLPSFDFCSKCGKPLRDKAFIDLALGGPLCERCSFNRDFKLGGEAIALIRVFREKPLEFFKKVSLSSRALNEIYDFLTLLFERVLGGVSFELSGGYIQA